jgi:hypothetical protein
MSKINISFNNTNYSIDESSFSTATAELKSHLSTIMNGSGATINLGGTAYNIDATKLATETNAFVSHLGTVAGNGYKVMVGGVEYGVDSAKMAGAVAEIEAVLAGLNNPDAPSDGDERLEGDGQVFNKFAPSTLSFRSTAPLNELQEVQINGHTVDPSNYTLEEGSTIVKLSHEYLSTLDVDNYELSVVSDSKTVKGDFTVASPELNEYGFYYDQPYFAYWEMSDMLNFGNAESAILLHSDGTASIYQIDSSERYTTTYTYIDNTLTLGFESDQFDPGTLTGIFTNDGKTIVGHIECDGGMFGTASGDADFEIAPNMVACDDYYVYSLYNSESEYEYFPKIITVDNYPAALSNILGIPVTTVAYEAFLCLDNFTGVTIPDSVTIIGPFAFSDCSSLTSINIPSGVIRIDISAFSYCTSLTSITFSGTIEQWNAIAKDDNWNLNVPATYVQCSDGQVAL